MIDDEPGPRAAAPAVFARDGLNPRVTHEGSVAFLTGPGLPRYDGFFWGAASASGGGPADADAPEGHDGPAEHWVGLGWLSAAGDDEVFLDGATGVLWVHRDGSGDVVPLNGSLAAFAAFLAAFHRDWRHIAPGGDYDDLHAAADNLMVELRPLDPVAFADPATSWWYALLGCVPTWY